LGKTSDHAGALASPGLSDLAVSEAGKDNNVIHLSEEELGNRGCGWMLGVPSALGGAAKACDLGAA